MKKLSLLLASALLLGLIAAPSGAKATMVRLGEDPAGDSENPSLDVTYLEVGNTPTALEIRIGMANILPGVRAVPVELPGVEWIFDVGDRTFLAEGVPGTRPSFYLFEIADDGTGTQMTAPEGTYEAADGFIRILVPLKDIGAKKGTLISGTGPKGTDDVDAHIHYPGMTTYPDYMATTKDYRVR